MNHSAIMADMNATMADEMLFSDGLRIIAGEVNKLNATDRALLVSAAEYLEGVIPALGAMDSALREVRSQLKAAQDKIAALTPKPVDPMSFGYSVSARMKIHHGFEVRK